MHTQTENGVAELSYVYFGFTPFHFKTRKNKNTFDQHSKSNVFFIYAYNAHKISCMSVLRTYTNSLYDIE